MPESAGGWLPLGADRLRQGAVGVEAEGVLPGEVVGVDGQVAGGGPAGGPGPPSSQRPRRRL